MSQPVRVTFVAGSLGGGGAERRLIDILQHLDPQRIAPRLYLAYRRGELLSEVPDFVPIDAFDDGITQRSFRQRLLAKFRCPSWARAWHLRDCLQSSRADAVISWSLLPSYETALACRRLSIPQIASVGVHPAAEIEDAWGRMSFWTRRCAGWTYQQSKLVLTNSSDLSKQFQSFYDLPATRVQTWLQTRDFDRIDQLAMAENPTWADLGRRIVVAGRLRPQKGFDVLLNAIAQVHSLAHPVQLVILGQGSAESDLRRQAAELGLAGQVRFLGFQANPFPYFRTADVFVLSSRFEGNPNTLIEALACRVPVISTDCPTGPREILQDGQWGPLIPVDDVEQLADSLRQVLASHPSADFLNKARQSVLDRYGLSNCTDYLDMLLRSVTSSTSASGSLARS